MFLILTYDLNRFRCTVVLYTCMHVSKHNSIMICYMIKKSAFNTIPCSLHQNIFKCSQMYWRIFRNNIGYTFFILYVLHIFITFFFFLLKYHHCNNTYWGIFVVCIMQHVLFFLLHSSISVCVISPLLFIICSIIK